MTLKERIYKAIAWALPADLVMWCGVRMWAFATSGKYGDEVAPIIPFDKVLKRWTNNDHKAGAL